MFFAFRALRIQKAFGGISQEALNHNDASLSLRRSAISGLVWTFAQQFGMQAISFIVTIFLARILSPAQFGLVAMINVFTALGSALADGGLSQSLIRAKEVGEKDFSTVFFTNFCISLLLYLILFLTAPLISVFYKQAELTDIIRVYGLLLLTTSLSAVQLTRLTKNLQFRIQLAVALPSLILAGIAGVLFALNGFGVWSLVYMGLLQSILSTMQLWIYTGWYPSIRNFSIDRLRYHFKFGINLTAVSVIHTIYLNVYSLIIGKYFSASTLGFYTRAISLRDIFVNNISTALNKVLYPTFAKIQDDNQRLKRAYKKVMLQVFFWVTPLLSCTAIFAEPMIRLVLTAKWLPMVPYFQILCFIGILTPVQTYNVNILKIKGRSDLFLRLEYVKKVIFLLGIFIGLQFGIYGLLINQVVSSLLGLYINSYYSGKLITYPLAEQLTDLWNTILVSSFISAIAFALLYYLKPGGFISDFALLVIGFIGYYLMFFAVSYFSRSEALKDFIGIISKKG